MKTTLDEIDIWLRDNFGIIPGACSSIENLKYTTARMVADALWPKKPSALTWEDMKLVIAAEGSIYDEHHGNSDEIFEAYPTEEEFYKEVLRRFQELKAEKK